MAVVPISLSSGWQAIRGEERAARVRMADAIDPLLHAYSQILFTRNRWVGLVLLLATLVRPMVGVQGLAAVLLSFVVVRLAQFSDELARQGLYSYNPLLVGLGIGAFLEPGALTAALLLIAVIAVVYLQTALESALGSFFNLPVLSLPFVLVMFLILAAVPFMKDARLIDDGLGWSATQSTGLAAFFETYLRSLGAIFFAPEILAGVLVFVALLLFSRIAVVLSMLGFATGQLLLVRVFDFTTPYLSLVVGYNFVLTAIALGGIWFVPQRSSFLFAMVGVLLAGLLTAASILFVGPFGLPVLILPFNLTLILLLYAMRQRVRDGSPKAVDCPVGSPEVNLNVYRTRIVRFGARIQPRLRLPVSGKWIVTQGIDGPHTHRGLWRHAFDLEVVDAAGRKHEGSGESVGDYFCYGLPVLAPADGSVVKVVDGVPDNPLGECNLRDNWGNLVMLRLAPGVHAMVCHLVPGSIQVREGQFVRQGVALGRCGNTGRSFVPHVHFQLQSSPRVGAPTIEAELHDVVTVDNSPRLHRSLVPAEGRILRNLERKDDIADLFVLPIGRRLRFDVYGDGPTRTETVRSCIDVFNNLYLESETTRGRLFFENSDSQFVVYDYQGPRRSLLAILHAAATRVPFDLPAGLEWDDVLSRRKLRSRWLGILVDFVDPFLPSTGQQLTFRAQLREGQLEIRGSGELGKRPIRTYARFTSPGGLEQLRLEVGEVRRSAVLREVLGDG